MRRREFIGILSGALTGGAPVARAQQSLKKTIAMVAPHRSVEELKSHPYYRAFMDQLSRLGFVEGHNLVVNRYTGNNQMGTYRDLAEAVVSTSPDAILSVASPLAFAFKAATQTIPIVAVIGDPVASGLVSSLARPGGNLTGATVDAGVELYGKRLELLVELRPSASRIGYLASSQNWSTTQAAGARAAAHRSNITLTHLNLGETLSKPAYLAAFGSLKGAPIDGLLVSDEPEHLENSKTLVDLAADARTPTMYPFRDLVVAGGLMAYAVDFIEVFRSAGREMAAILRGQSPAEIPVYEPTKFLLIINTKAARRIALDLSPTILASADEVVE